MDGIRRRVLQNALHLHCTHRPVCLETLQGESCAQPVSRDWDGNECGVVALRTPGRRSEVAKKYPRKVCGRTPKENNNIASRKAILNTRNRIRARSRTRMGPCSY